MRTGFLKALELGAQIVVKVDGDDQMDLTYLPDMLVPLIEGRADYTKGNRFRDFQALQQMPFIRRAGNMALGFLTKAATGYWNLFDPTNGFVAIRADVLVQLPLQRIDRTFFFETSMLANLYMIGAVVRDVPMPARYRGESSNLSVRRTLFEFPFKLIQTFFRRLAVKYMIYDFLDGIHLHPGRAAAPALRSDLRFDQMGGLRRAGRPRADRDRDAAHPFGPAGNPVPDRGHRDRPAFHAEDAALAPFVINLKENPSNGTCSNRRCSRSGRSRPFGWARRSRTISRRDIPAAGNRRPADHCRSAR
jgi:hypothetical protein